MSYSIGEMAKILGVPASTLRYYDKEGILPFVSRTLGGIRKFSDKDFEWLKVLECLRKSGLTIKDIKVFTDLVNQGDNSLKERLALFQARRDEVRSQMRELEETLKLLEFKCWYYEEAIRQGTEEKLRDATAHEIPECHRDVKEKILRMPLQ